MPGFDGDKVIVALPDISLSAVTFVVDLVTLVSSSSLLELNVVPSSTIASVNVVFPVSCIANVKVLAVPSCNTVEACPMPCTLNSLVSKFASVVATP